jgi:hypothetical protein
MGSVLTPFGAMLMVTALAVAPAARACGYHDAASINLGMLNVAYPDALFVRTAVWMAQRDHLIATSEQPGAADSPTEKFRNSLLLRQTLASLEGLRGRLAAAAEGQPVPRLAMVFIRSMLWARFEAQGGTLRLEAHASGPASGDVVMVTDEPVVTALLDGRLKPRDARDLGLFRLYGPPAAVAEVASLIERLAPMSPGTAARSDTGSVAGHANAYSSRGISITSAGVTSHE